MNSMRLPCADRESNSPARLGQAGGCFERMPTPLTRIATRVEGGESVIPPLAVRQFLCAPCDERSAEFFEEALEIAGIEVLDKDVSSWLEFSKWTRATSSAETPRPSARSVRSSATAVLPAGTCTSIQSAAPVARASRWDTSTQSVYRMKGSDKRLQIVEPAQAQIGSGPRPAGWTRLCNRRHAFV